MFEPLVTMATNLPFCFFIQFLEQLLKFLVNFTLLKYVKSQRSYGFLITKELILGGFKSSLPSLFNCRIWMIKTKQAFSDPLIQKVTVSLVSYHSAFELEILFIVCTV